ncbi:MAG: fibronectin type III domain-containing protein [Gammaproteobacteria bacterium]|nr:fibronectin type III domain-containing protein [Gammaproteobacteria bacterium]
MSGSRAATVSWEAPTSNTNGSALTDLAGYRIYYGAGPDQLSHTVQIRTVGLQTYVIEDLEPGTWYFAVMAVASDGTESTLSEVVAKTIT